MMAAHMPSASWNPAFMPNSHADLDATHNATPESSMPERHTTYDHPYAEDDESPVEKIQSREDECAEIGNGQHEIEKLRGALTTSLASPGGVEMADTPWHNDETQHEGADQVKADFPSQGPSNEGKHLSTMSFARTVSEDFSWGEDDEVDTEWNLHRSETDPFKTMGNTDRTNSFPAVPPLHANGPSAVKELPHSQAEEIMQQVDQEASRDLFEDDGTDPAEIFFSQTAESPSMVDESFKSGFGRPIGTEVKASQVEDSDARYEEGLPLVSHEEEDIETNPPLNPGLGEHDDAAENDDFFAQVNKLEGEGVSGLQLERKSTMQVMNSLNFQHQQAHGDIEEEEEGGESQSWLNQNGDDSNGSSDLSMSKTFGGGVDDHLVSTAQPDMGVAEDLAAKWKAALDDEFLGDDDDELLPDDDEQIANQTGVDPSTLFDDDDEGFLEDEEETSVEAFPAPTPAISQNDHSRSYSGSNRPGSSESAGRYIPAGATRTAPSPSNVYAPAAPLLTDLSRPAYVASTTSPYMAAVSSFHASQPSRPELPKAQSFADKSKGGYSSPYDLPMDIVKPPRKRSSIQQMGRASAAPPNIAPPRSSSMLTQGSPSLPNQPPSAHQSHSPSSTAPTSAPLVKTVRKSQSGFFEELPMSTKPKLAPRNSSGLASPSISPYGAVHSPQVPSMATPVNFTPPNVSQHHSGLVAPERVSPYASLPSGNSPVPPVASRYSPAPTSTGAQMVPPPVTQSRYSPAPNAARQQATYSAPPVSQPPPAPLPHQPRTSSPLAHFERHRDPRAQNLGTEPTNFDRRSSSSGHESSLRYQHLPPTRELEESEDSASAGKSYGELQNHYNQPMSPPGQAMRPVSQTPPPPQGLASRLVNSPPKRAMPNYAPEQAPHGLQPLKRSQTQSPTSHFSANTPDESDPAPYQQPASVHVQTSPRMNSSYASMQSMSLPSRPRGFSQGLNYIAPTDGRELDDLQRWRGAPVFAWGVGGTIVTSFPKDVPRYGINQTIPSIVRSPGEVKVKNIKDMDPLQAQLASFPGPLKGKSKKKEVLAWLASGIAMLESNAAYLRTASNLSHEDKRTEERILLWKILSVFIEHDGILEGTPVVDKAVRAVISPGIDSNDSSAPPLYATGADLSGISQSSNSAPRAEAVDPSAVDQLRKHLLRGDREKAVWEAVDKRLWAHAMLISNTVSPDLYKQVAQEFVQKEVKNIGDNTESLAALYEIFAGNFEESIDELVPPSARAGFQMVSASNASGPSKGALDGLDRWRETLGLVLSNRSVDDTRALSALGKLLSGYGRAEAAHTCFLFARSLSIFGGADDAQSCIVLVGSDHLRQPYDFDRELEPVLLSEIFEYGISLAAPASAVAFSSPHLSAYKLQHAKILAEYGYRDKALQYCETIGTSFTAQTRRSPYHHNLLVSEIDDLSKRLKQSPKDDSGSWISKPSLDKAKGSVWATFNKFVSGEGEDETATGTGAVNSDIGPFARIAGGTPTISRSPSNSEIFGSNGSATMPITKASSRYAPGSSHSTNAYEPQSATSYGSQPRGSFEERSSGEFRRNDLQPQMNDYRPSSQPFSAANPYMPSGGSNFTPPSSYIPQGNSYQASPYAPQTPVSEQPPSNVFTSPKPITGFGALQQSGNQTPSEGYNQSQPSSFDGRQNTFGPSAGYEPFTSSSYDPPSSTGYEPPTQSYEPSTGGYEPPSYEPTSINDEPDSPLETRPKKKSFMDDDDDDIPALRNSSASREKTKAEKDREADEAFRKAAEADAQKTQETPAKKGWGLGGWFGGAKKEPDAAAAQPKAIKAKLGEESSFVYDPELKRWINKKAGAEQTEAKSAAPPPPPRTVGPPRTASAGPTSQPRPPMATPPPMQQRAVSESVTPSPSDEYPTLMPPLGGLAPPGMIRTASNGSLPPMGSSGPSSRPGTAMSNASSIDDLLGPPVPRKGTAAVKKGAKKKGRGYVDVMGEKAT